MRKQIDELLNISGVIINQSVVNVWRLFSESDFEEIPQEKRDEESDGNTYIEFSNGIVIGFYPNTELFTLDYEYIELSKVPKNTRNVSNNLFWVKRRNKKILNVKGIYGNRSNPYGITIELEGAGKIELRYISESEYTFDALIIG